MVIRNKQRKTHTEQSRRKTNTQPENQQNNEQRDSDDGLKWPEDDFMKMFSYFLVTRLKVATLSTKIISIKISLLKNENKSQQIQMKPLISSLKSSNCCKIKYKGRYFICLDQWKVIKMTFSPKGLRITFDYNEGPAHSLTVTGSSHFLQSQTSWVLKLSLHMLSRGVAATRSTYCINLKILGDIFLKL